MYGYFAVRALKFCSKVLLSNHFENISQARRQGDARGAHAPFAPPPPKKNKSQKGPPDDGRIDNLNAFPAV